MWEFSFLRFWDLRQLSIKQRHGPNPILKHIWLISMLLSSWTCVLIILWKAGEDTIVFIWQLGIIQFKNPVTYIFILNVWYAVQPQFFCWILCSSSEAEALKWLLSPCVCVCVCNSCTEAIGYVRLRVDGPVPPPRKLPPSHWPYSVCCKLVRCSNCSSQSNFLHDKGLFVSLRLLHWPFTYEHFQPLTVCSPAQLSSRDLVCWENSPPVYFYR